MVYAETLFSYPDWKIPFTVHTDASDKQLGAVISQNNKPISFFSIILSKTQRNYTTNEKELLGIVECLKQFCGIIFVYKINVFPYHKNMVYAPTLSEAQRVVRWLLIIKYSGTNIQNIYVVDNILTDTLSRFPYIAVDKYNPSTSKAHCNANKLLSMGR